MTEQTTGQPDSQPTGLFRGVYGQPYNDLVHPARVWTVSKYFLRRWSAYLPPPAIWLVIGARQLSYLNRRRPWFEAYDSALANAAGLNVDVFRRTLKREIAEQNGPLAHFLSKESDPAYIVREGSPCKGRTRYTVRLDDPLTPGDATSLKDWLQKRLDPKAGAQEVIDVLQAARALDPKHLWAQDLTTTEIDEETLPLSVVGIVRRLLPQLDGASAEDSETTAGHWTEEADALHSHLVGGEIVHLEPHYFREQWLPVLGPGPALLIVTLRSLCYLNEETGDIRDVVRTEAGELAQRLQTTRRTLRRWFNKLDKAAQHDTLFGPFFTFLENNKQPDQSVIASYRINLKMPLTPDDFDRYREHMTDAGPDGDVKPLRRAVNGHTDKKSVTKSENAGKEKDKKSAPEPSRGDVADKISVPAKDLEDKPSAPAAGERQIIGHGRGGSGQKVATSATKGRPFKDYKRLLTALNLKDFAQLEQRTEQQYQYLWHMADGQAQEPFAVVVAGNSLVAMLDLLNIQEPTRSRILQRDPPLVEILAWYLYAQRQSNLEQPVAYVVARVLEGDHPPQPFLQLASLSWEQWRTYATLSALALFPGSRRWQFEAFSGFREWFALYGGVPPDSLPFQVGAGLSLLRIAYGEGDGVSRENSGVQGASGEERGSWQAAPDRLGQQGPEAQLWQEALSELALQMTQSTFDAWLRHSRFVLRQDQEWTIAVDSPAAQSWLQNRLSGVVERTLSGVVGQDASVRFVVKIVEENVLP